MYGGVRDMSRSPLRLMLIWLVALTAVCGTASSMTMCGGSRSEEFVLPDDLWRFLRGTAPASEPADAWTQIGFDDSAWETGRGGFGCGDDDDATILDDMGRNYINVY